MSKRLCFIASMPRSNRTLSGCLESTLASGLSTFLFVHAVVSASVAARAITEVRRDSMDTSGLVISDRLSVIRTHCMGWSPITGNRPLLLHFLQRCFQRRLQQSLSVNHRIAVTEHSVARNQNFCSGPHYACHGVQRNPAIYFNSIVKIALLAQAPELAQLM